jgi:D-glycero-alpha-D-manno-heptose-7-phosphate kinase
MKRALLQSRLDNFGALLHAGWENKKRLASGITNPLIDEMYGAALRAGAIGGKILGAGGGGYLLLSCPATRRHAVARECERLGGTPVPFQFEAAGLRTWHASSLSAK